MKHLLTIVATLFVLNTQAQLSKIETSQTVDIGKIKRTGVLAAQLSYSVNEGDTTYVLAYDDATYQRVTNFRSVSFDEAGGTLEGLYQAMKEAIDKEKGFKQSFVLGETHITISTQKMMGIPYLYFHVADKGFFMVNVKEIDKLFGKR